MHLNFDKKIAFPDQIVQPLKLFTPFFDFVIYELSYISQFLTECNQI